MYSDYIHMITALLQLLNHVNIAVLCITYRTLRLFKGWDACIAITEGKQPLSGYHL
jgi:hypothetical protein